MIVFSRIIGFILFLVFGSQFFLLNMRKARIEQERILLQNKSNYAFARISRTQKVLGPFGNHYYFNIKGSYKGESFEKSERVLQELYHLYSVGSNVEILIHQRKNRRAIIHIRKNTIRHSSDLTLLIRFSKFTAMLGLAFLVFGFIIGPLSGRTLKFKKLNQNHRPNPQEFYEN